MAFEILGLDIILNSKLKPYLLEVNHSPSFSTDCPIDYYVKKKVIHDSLVLSGVTAAAKRAYNRKVMQQVS